MEPGITVNAEIYCRQLEDVHTIHKDEYESLMRKGVILLHDNARPHHAKKTRELLSEMEGVTVLRHPPYSPDAAPSDYGLFRSLQHFLKGRNFESVEELEAECWLFFLSKNLKWYHRQFTELEKRWKKIVHSGGDYCNW